MPAPSASEPRPTAVLRLFPELFRLFQRRLTSQVRLMGSALLIGVVAGIGAIGFYLATRVMEHYCLGVVVGYVPGAHPTGETDLSWLPPASKVFHPWLLLVVPTIGGL